MNAGLKKTRKASACSCFRNKFIITVAEKRNFLRSAQARISPKKGEPERLRILANTDTVTGLPNRNAIHEFINHAIASAGESRVGIVYLDLDSTKKLMTPMGICLAISSYRPVSLALLQVVWRKTNCWQTGGDEFIVTRCPYVSGRAGSSSLTNRTPRLRGNRFVLDSLKFYTGCAVAFRWPPARTGRSQVSFALPTPQCIAKEGGPRSVLRFRGNESARILTITGWIQAQRWKKQPVTYSISPKLRRGEST